MGKLTRQKAAEILHDGTVHGNPITDKQRRYFGAVSSGYASGNGVSKQRRQRVKSMLSKRTAPSY